MYEYVWNKWRVAAEAWVFSTFTLASLTPVWGADNIVGFQK